MLSKCKNTEQIEKLEPVLCSRVPERNAVKHSTNEPGVALVMLNWNCWQDTVFCLDSVDKLDYEYFEVIVCDNGSQDESIEHLKMSRYANRHGYRLLDSDFQLVSKESAPDSRRNPLIIIHNAVNLGFAGGNNIGMKYALDRLSGVEYVWLLNSDTEADPNALKSIVEKIQETEEIGSVQSLLVNYSDRHRLDSAGIELRCRGGARDAKRYNTLDQIESDRPIFGCCAASALYRVSALRAVGLFDESFFAVNEDVDLAFRLRHAGYHAYLARRSIVFHKGGVSRKKKNRTQAFIAHRNKLILMARWWPAAIALPMILFGVLRLLVFLPLTPGRGWQDWLQLLRDLTANFRNGADKQMRLELYRKWMK